jgi:hypothetical protein
MLGMLLMLMLLPLLILLRDGSNRAPEGSKADRRSGTNSSFRHHTHVDVSCQIGVCVSVARLLFEMYGKVQNVSS